MTAPTVALTCANCLIVSRICCVEDPPVGDDDDRVEDVLAVALEPDQLVREPGDRVRLAAAGRVLDQVALAGSVLGRVGEQAADDVELVVARPDLRHALLAGLLVLEGDDLRVVLEDVGEPARRQDLLPEVVGLEPVRVRRVAGAVVPAAVERQEPRRLAGQVGAEADLGVVDREVGDAAAELEQLLARVAVALVLLDGVVDRLLRQAVLQLERRDRQAVDEQAEVERELRLVGAVAELPRDAEAVAREELDRRLVVRRRRPVEEVDVVRPVLDPVAEDVDRAALRDLALQPREEACAASARRCRARARRARSSCVAMTKPRSWTRSTQ